MDWLTPDRAMVRWITTTTGNTSNVLYGVVPGDAPSSPAEKWSEEELRDRLEQILKLLESQRLFAAPEPEGEKPLRRVLDIRKPKCED